MYGSLEALRASLQTAAAEQRERARVARLRRGLPYFQWRGTPGYWRGRAVSRAVARLVRVRSEN